MTLNTSAKTRRWICAAIFVILLTANFLTPKVVDDWSYGFSFATGAPIASLGDIGPSMRAHSQYINGRLIAHTLVQVFEFFPKWIFNVLNAAAFLALLWQLYRLCRRDGEESNLLLAVLFAAVWVFSPAFGQVFLWLDGSCNYGWGSLLALWWLGPYVRLFLFPARRRKAWQWLAWMIPGFFSGGYLENISAAAIGVGALLLVLTRLHRKEKTGQLPWLGIAAALVGFAFMLTRPAESMKSEGSDVLTALGSRFVVALNAYRMLEVLVFFFAVAFTLCCLAHTCPERRLLAVVLALGSLGSNFLLVFAAYYPERCLIFPALLLIAGCGILFADLFSGDRRTLTLCCAAALAVSLIFSGLYGMADITHTYLFVRANEAAITEARESGERSVRVPMVNVYTKYSPLYNLKYLDTEDPNSWPNHSMARTLGVDEIIGYWEE